MCQEMRGGLDESAVETEPALEVLLKQRERFLGFLARRAGSRAIAEELLQSAYLTALERGESFETDASAVAWFHRVLRNALIDHVRRQRSEARAIERELSELPDGAHDAELESAVCACMHDLLPTLKPEYAEMVRHVDLDQRSVAEVARDRGITANNAGVRLHRARQALKRQLERTCGACAAHGCLDCRCKGARAATRSSGHV